MNYKKNIIIKLIKIMIFKEQQEEQIILQSELSHNKNTKTRNAIKFDFTLQEKQQAKTYISDLENSLALNKEIIVELIKSNIPNGQSKKIIEMLSTENASLHNQVKKLISERNEMQAKLLISEQIIQNLKKNEEELRKELTSVQRELVDQLNRKEFALQKVESRYDKALSMINNMAHKDQDARRILKNLKADRRSEFKLTNVIEENERLQEELKREKELVKDLITQLNNQKDGTTESKDYLQDSSYIKMRGKSPLEGRIRTKSLMGVTSENKDGSKKEVAELSKKIIELYKVNISLSDALKQANKCMGVSREKSLPKRSRNKSRIDYRTDEKFKSCLHKLEEREQGVNNTKVSFKKERSDSIENRK